MKNIGNRAARRVVGVVLLLLSFVPYNDVWSSDEEAYDVEQRLFWLSSIWKELHYKFAFLDDERRRWMDEQYINVIPRIISADDTLEFYQTLQKFVAQLADGHTFVRAPYELVEQSIGFPEIRVKWIERQAVVVGIGSSLGEDIALGDIVVSVDGIPVVEHLRSHVFPLISAPNDRVRFAWGVQGDLAGGWGLLAGPLDSIMRLGMRSMDGRDYEVSVSRVANSAPIAWKQILGASARREFAFRWLDEDVLYINLPGFHRGILDEFHSSLPQIRKAKGLILDLRQNSGGLDSVAFGILAHFTDKPIYGSTWKTPIHVAAFEAWNAEGVEMNVSPVQGALIGTPYTGWIEQTSDPVMPKDERFLVPVAVLTGVWTASAAEDFLVATDALDQVIRVGESTFGSTGMPFRMSLPDGGFAMICTKHDSFPDAREFVGDGVAPHVTIADTLHSVWSGKDRVLDGAHQLVLDRL